MPANAADGGDVHVTARSRDGRVVLDLDYPRRRGDPYESPVEGGVIMLTGLAVGTYDVVVTTSSGLKGTHTLVLANLDDDWTPAPIEMH
jgi:hypothetical protein